MAQLRRGARSWIDHTQQDLAEAIGLLNAAIGTIKLNPLLCQDQIDDASTLLRRIAHRLPDLEEMLQRAEQSHQTANVIDRLTTVEQRLTALEEYQRAPLGNGARHSETGVH